MEAGLPAPGWPAAGNFSDVVSFLGRTSVFKDGGLPSPSIALRDSAEEVAAAADKMIEAELSPSGPASPSAAEASENGCEDGLPTTGGLEKGGPPS